MSLPRPGTLAVRAVNEYRRRDILPYLSLRYYLENRLARSDRWARQVATELVSTRTASPYFHAHHFKELDTDGKPRHRCVCLPGANEALAEAALLAECARHTKNLVTPPCVYSYRLARENDRSGIFEHYTQGLCLRQAAVARACDDSPNGVVQYLDIQRFYPSITVARAREVWRRHAEAARLAGAFIELGSDLIDHHEMMRRPQEEGILTGPMFSHFMGNLVLRDLDASCGTLPAKYFRYVDDIILVGQQDAVHDATEQVERRLNELGFNLHPESSPKRLTVPAQKWLEGRLDFNRPEHHFSWRRMIGDLKRFLLKGGDAESLRAAFQAEGFRIPISNYSGASRERSFVERFRELVEFKWFRRKTDDISVASLLLHARQMRLHCEREFPRLVDQTINSTGFDCKRLLPKLRFLAGRLVYVGSEEFLASWSSPLVAIPQLHQQGRVMEAIATKRADNLLPLGGNVAQAVAQPFSTMDGGITIERNVIEPAEIQALAVLKLNGLMVEIRGGSDYRVDDLFRFAQTGSDPALMMSDNAFLRQLACLHGLTPSPRHAEMLSTAFDQDEVLILDAIEQLSNSGLS